MILLPSGLKWFHQRVVVLLCVSCEGPTAVKDEEFSLEGSNVPLSFTYSKLVSSDYFFWYQQHPGKPPKLLISHSASGQVTSPNPRYNVTVEDKQITMIIISAAVSDSAVYYCALQPTVTGNSTSLYKNLWSKDNTILHNVH
ncbi:hypothetical protein Q5P01_022975 [Channa striata]|uniref:Immunoglobulin V-set domain-containing protein n=1 Tax=Channa striata TaxID=64152 RepID=A0AA88S7L2_CHASR|nr:hypothetical protein Q5P01_022975 [Channa striata]